MDKIECSTNTGKNWLTNRVVDEWNRLCNRVVNTGATSTLMERLHILVRDKLMATGAV